jgi:hypothetical protein
MTTVTRRARDDQSECARPADRIVIVTLLGVVIAIVARGVFARAVPVLTLAPDHGRSVALATRRLRRWWRALALTVATAASTVAVAIATDGGFSDAAAAVVQGPRRLLTTEWPSPVEPSSWQPSHCSSPSRPPQRPCSPTAAGGGSYRSSRSRSPR